LTVGLTTILKCFIDLAQLRNNLFLERARINREALESENDSLEMEIEKLRAINSRLQVENRDYYMRLSQIYFKTLSFTEAESKPEKLISTMESIKEISKVNTIDTLNSL
jgi:hypothetical protein